jgi:hypothetical protein
MMLLERLYLCIMHSGPSAYLQPVPFSPYARRYYVDYVIDFGPLSTGTLEHCLLNHVCLDAIYPHVYT